ncbi:LysR family transcriptional regulator [Pseudoglutamicibacter cumminsii]|uniref:LysR family transcriptional regulator n=1 Tax=Pseudoglutamicibacter cumminsii TaxID=156979 RepID=UPI00195608F2|nr:LysR family transcriptional regulator [Pseudoglutamicibacter cumminsii]MBM7795648.1 DNA-binding transcriptional LysR family regulator [Pseudoglutamicibacter cumminsii]
MEGMNVTFRQLEYFLAVLDHGSMSAAADACHVTQANISSAIAALEKDIGTQLILRGKGQRSVLTPAGERYAQRVRGVLTDIAEAHQEAKSAGGRLRGPLKIGGMQSTIVLYFPDITAHFAQHHSEVDLSFIEAGPRGLEEAVAQGKIDAALMLGQQRTRTDLAVDVVGRVRLKAVLHEDHPLAVQEQVSIKDLAMHTVIALDPPEIQRPFLQKARNLGVEISPRWRFASWEAIRSFVRRGLGVAVSNIAPPEVLTGCDSKSTESAHESQALSAEGGLVYRPLAEEVFQNTIDVVYRKTQFPQEKIQELIRVAKKIGAETL